MFVCSYRSSFFFISISKFFCLNTYPNKPHFLETTSVYVTGPTYKMILESHLVKTNDSCSGVRSSWPFLISMMLIQMSNVRKIAPGVGEYCNLASLLTQRYPYGEALSLHLSRYTRSNVCVPIFVLLFLALCGHYSRNSCS